MTRWIRHPGRCDNTEIPAQLLIAAQFLAIATLDRGPYHSIGRFHRSIPYLEYLELLGTEYSFGFTLGLLYIIGNLLLFWTKFVRSGCLLIGGVTLLGLLACRPHLSVADTYAGCFFLMVGLSSKNTGTWLIRAQTVVLYFGASVNKLLDADWWTGAFMHTMLSTRYEEPVYLWLTAKTPLFPWAISISIITMAVQLIVALCLLSSKYWRFGILVGLTFHSSLTLLMGTPFGPFYHAVIASYLCFMPWPEKLHLHLPQRLLSWVKHLDSGDIIQLNPGPWRLRLFGKDYHSLDALLRCVFFSPAFFLALGVLLRTGRWGGTVREIVMIALALIFARPLYQELFPLDKESTAVHDGAALV